MADLVATQKIVDGPRNAVIRFTNVSDGTGESAVTKVDVATLSATPGSVRIDKIVYSTVGMSVNILWDATTPVLATSLPADRSDTLDFCCDGGLPNPKATGWTGNIKFTTVGHTLGDTYTVVLYLVKKP